MSVRRGAELLRNARLAAGVVALHLGEDPLLLLLQVSRRLPRPVVRAGSGLLLLGTGRAGHRRPLARAALGTWLAGAADESTTLTARLQRRDLRGVRGRLVTELAVQLGGPAGPASRSLRLRAAWARGDVRTAVEPGDGSLLASRLRSEVALLQPVERFTPAPRAVGSDGSLRVLHLLTNSLPHTQSGYTRRSHAVLLAQQQAGVDVLAVTRLGYPVVVGALRARHRDVVDGVPYQRVVPDRLAPTAAGRVQQQVELLMPAAERFGPDVLHTTTDYPNALVVQSVAGRLGVPWVYEVRGMLEETWVASRPAGAARETAAASERHRLVRDKETEMASAADHVVTLSCTLAAELAGRGVDARAITVVPNAVDDAWLQPLGPSSVARLALGLPAAGFWVGTVSSLVDYEGLDTLVAAVALLRGRGVDVRLAVVGDGVSRQQLERQAREAGVGEHAVFPGRVPYAVAQVHHRALDVFVVPRRDVQVCRRVTPLKPIEAMATGRPVVASDLPALAELVQPHGSGLLVPPGDVVALADALHLLHDQDESRTRCGAAGRAFAATRTWSRAGLAYRDLYEQLTTATVP